MLLANTTGDIQPPPHSLNKLISLHIGDLRSFLRQARANNCPLPEEVC